MKCDTWGPYVHELRYLNSCICQIHYFEISNNKYFSYFRKIAYTEPLKRMPHTTIL